MNLVEWSYNTSLHSSRGMTPCEVTYDKPSPSIPGYILDSSPNEGVDSILTTQTKIHEDLK